jgi:hypothetical protein
MAGTDGALPEEAAALYRVEPTGFIAARTDLVARLRDEGRDADAAAVKALRKPTVVVWALDQLAVRDPDGVSDLLDAGRELRAAQQAAVSARGAADRLRSATAARREVVRRLTAVATGALDEVGSAGRTQADAIAAALESASIDEEAGRLLAAGTLTALPGEGAGFGTIFGLQAVPDAPSSPGPKRAATAKPDLPRLRRERDAAAKADRVHREHVERATAKVADLRERLERAEAALADAKVQARATSMEAKRAQRELEKAERVR